MHLRRIETPEGEIGKAGVKFGLGVSAQETTARALAVRACRLEPRHTPVQRQARMSERVPASDAREQQGGAGISGEMARMGGELREEQQRAPIRVGRDRGE